MMLYLYVDPKYPEVNVTPVFNKYDFGKFSCYGHIFWFPLTKIGGFEIPISTTTSISDIESLM